MSSLRERLASAVAPTYDVVDLLGRGGMGAVYRAFDRGLDRWVAIKVLLPERATEVAERRFLREARTLARLRHPLIVPIHLVEQKGGLSFFVMDLIDGPTLDHLVARGTFDPHGTIQLGKDLLDALRTVHQHEVVHCDIKPANIFVTGGRAVLSDFGIATRPRESDTTETLRGIVGTPAYMSPEQLEGVQPTPKMDIYSVSMVLYEALTGSRWITGVSPSRGHWNGVPRGLKRVLQCGLEIDPAARWDSAGDFRNALVGLERPSRSLYVAAAIGAAAVLTIAGFRVRAVRETSEHLVRIAPAVMPRATRSEAVTVADVLHRDLGVGIDFQFCRSGTRCDRAAMTIHVSVLRRSDSSIISAVSSGGESAVSARMTVPAGQSITSLGPLAAEILLQVWQKPSAILDDLPTNALPHSAEGMREFIAAEQLWHAGRFSDAKRAYERAIDRDATCSLCSWRITEMNRWLVEDPDSVHLRRVRQNQDDFPEHYKLLFMARDSTGESRLRMLLDAFEGGKAFPLARFAYADELFHRGALVGQPLEDAADELYLATQRNPRFVPALEHAAWAAAALGDTVYAQEIRERLDLLPPDPRDVEAQIYRALTTTALSYRFGDGPDTRQLMGQLPALLQDPRADAGPRWMIGFAAPEGAIQLGRLWAQMAEMGSDVRAGLLGQYVGRIVQGQLDSARSIATQLSQSFAYGDFAAFDVLLRSALAFVDLDRGALEAAVGEVVALDRESLPPEMRRSVAFMTTLLNGGVRSNNVNWDAAERELIEAVAMAEAGDTVGALARTEPRVLSRLGSDVFATRNGNNVFYRSMLYAFRAAWFEASGQTGRAIESLRWVENRDMYDIPLGQPKVYEIDWSLGVAASWRRARLLDDNRADAESCRLYAEVARVWQFGDSKFAERADSAATRWKTRRCGPSTIN